VETGGEHLSELGIAMASYAQEINVLVGGE